jgi:methylamine dehydrogenase accessory protein MauD
MFNATAFQITYVLLWSLTLLLLATVLFLGRQIGSLYQRLGPIGARMANPGPKMDAAIDQMTLADIDGRDVVIGGRRERRSLLVFMSPGCSSCDSLASGLRAIARHEKHSLDVILVSSGSDPLKHQQFREHHKIRHLPYVLSAEMRTNMNITGVPYALLLDEDGVLRSKGIVNSLAHLESLVNTLDSGHRSLEEFRSSQRKAAASA